MNLFSYPLAAMRITFARTTSRYGAVYRAARPSSTDRSWGVSSMVNGLLLGMRSPFAQGEHASGGPCKPVSSYNIVVMRGSTKRTQSVSDGDGGVRPSDAGAIERPELGPLGYDLSLLTKPRVFVIRSVRDTPAELAAFAALREYILDNPREIKRLVNL